MYERDVIDSVIEDLMEDALPRDLAKQIFLIPLLDQLAAAGGIEDAHHKDNCGYGDLDMMIKVMSRYYPITEADKAQLLRRYLDAFCWATANPHLVEAHYSA